MRSGAEPEPQTVALLHGFTGCGESWQDVIAALPSQAVCQTPTLLGHDRGSSSSIQDNQESQSSKAATSFEAEIDRLAREIREQGVGPHHLVGYSLGGRLALGLLIRYRNLWSGATLIGVHPGLETEEERIERGASDEGWAAKLESEGLESFLAAWEKLPLFASQHRLSVPAQEAQRRIRRRHSALGLARSLRVLSLARMPNYRPRLVELDLPITLVAGELDPKFRALADWMAQRMPKATLRVAPGAGHNVVLESPQEVARWILE